MTLRSAIRSAGLAALAATVVIVGVGATADAHPPPGWCIDGKGYNGPGPCPGSGPTPEEVAEFIDGLDMILDQTQWGDGDSPFDH